MGVFINFYNMYVVCLFFQHGGSILYSVSQQLPGSFIITRVSRLLGSFVITLVSCITFIHLILTEQPRLRTVVGMSKCFGCVGTASVGKVPQK